MQLGQLSITDQRMKSIINRVGGDPEHTEKKDTTFSVDQNKVSNSQNDDRRTLILRCQNVHF